MWIPHTSEIAREKIKALCTKSQNIKTRKKQKIGIARLPKQKKKYRDFDMRRLDYSPSIDELVEDHFKSQISQVQYSKVWRRLRFPRRLRLQFPAFFFYTHRLQVSNRSISQRPRELLRQKNSSFEFSNDYRSVSQERKNLKTTISPTEERTAVRSKSLREVRDVEIERLKKWICMISNYNTTSDNAR